MFPLPPACPHGCEVRTQFIWVDFTFLLLCPKCRKPPGLPLNTAQICFLQHEIAEKNEQISHLVNLTRFYEEEVELMQKALEESQNDIDVLIRRLVDLRDKE